MRVAAIKTKSNPSISRPCVTRCRYTTSKQRTFTKAQKELPKKLAPRAPPPPPEGTLGYDMGAQAANGSSIAYKTIGTFLSQKMRQDYARGRATEMQSSGCAAVRQWPTLSFDHRTCEFDLFLSS